MTTTPKAHHAATFPGRERDFYNTAKAATVNSGKAAISVVLQQEERPSAVLALDPSTAIELAIDLIERAHEILKEQS